MGSLGQDLRFALRHHLQRPGLTAVAVLSMALGLGVATAAFGVLYGLLLRPLPFQNADSLVAVSAVHDELVWGSGSVSYLDFQDLRRESTLFEGVEAHRGAGSLVLAGPEGPERIDVDAVSAGLFPLLGVEPIAGRQFLPREDRPDQPGVLLLSHSLWQRRFHADRSVVGRTIQANGKPHLVVGVMPPGFQFPDLQEAWVPLGSRWAKGTRSDRIVHVLARLRPWVALLAARAFWLQLRADGPVLLFALAVSVGAALLFGIMPALQAVGIDLRRTLKDGGGSGGRPPPSVRRQRAGPGHG